MRGKPTLGAALSCAAFLTTSMVLPPYTVSAGAGRWGMKSSSSDYLAITETDVPKPLSLIASDGNRQDSLGRGENLHNNGHQDDNERDPVAKPSAILLLGTVLLVGAAILRRRLRPSQK